MLILTGDSGGGEGRGVGRRRRRRKAFIVQNVWNCIISMLFFSFLPPSFFSPPPFLPLPQPFLLYTPPQQIDYFHILGVIATGTLSFKPVSAFHCLYVKNCFLPHPPPTSLDKLWTSLMGILHLYTPISCECN